MSAFFINCKELIRYLSGKYEELKKKLIELISKKLKEKIKNGFNMVKQIKKQIQKQASNIEELTETKKYIE